MKKNRKRLPPNKKFRKALSNRVRQLRKKEKMSQDQLAFEAGIHKEHVGRIERGEQSVTADILVSIANVFEMKVKELLDFEY